MDKDKLVDEKRREAITFWWERVTLREFIAAKRAALRSHAQKEG